MTVATTNGVDTRAFRYSSQRDSRSLFYSTDVPTLRALHPEVEILAEVSDESRLIVSEPLRDLPGARTSFIRSSRSRRRSRWPSAPMHRSAPAC